MIKERFKEAWANFCYWRARAWGIRAHRAMTRFDYGAAKTYLIVSNRWMRRGLRRPT
jgi:hypothetical protein